MEPTVKVWESHKWVWQWTEFAPSNTSDRWVLFQAIRPYDDITPRAIILFDTKTQRVPANWEPM